ncbi:MAG: hypothetical protein AAGA90_23300 [Actinomycetota bacterium]
MAYGDDLRFDDLTDWSSSYREQTTVTDDLEPDGYDFGPRGHAPHPADVARGLASGLGLAVLAWSLASLHIWSLIFGGHPFDRADGDVPTWVAVVALLWMVALGVIVVVMGLVHGLRASLPWTASASTISIFTTIAIWYPQLAMNLSHGAVFLGVILILGFGFQQLKDAGFGLERATQSTQASLRLIFGGLLFTGAFLAAGPGGFGWQTIVVIAYVLPGAEGAEFSIVLLWLAKVGIALALVPYAFSWIISKGSKL